jgi:hypothetical protein
MGSKWDAMMETEYFGISLYQLLMMNLWMSYAQRFIEIETNQK